MSQLIETVMAHYHHADDEEKKRGTKPVSMRVDTYALHAVDFLATKLNLNRSQTISLILEEAVSDLLVEIAKAENPADWKPLYREFYDTISENWRNEP